MQAGCGAWVWVMHVADDVLRLEAWGLGVSVNEASFPPSSCGCSARVVGDSARGRVNDVFVRIIFWSIPPSSASCCSESLRWSGSFTPATVLRIACDWESILSGLPVHLSAAFGVVCEFPHPPIAISPPPRRPHWNWLQSSLGKYGRAEGQGGQGAPR